MALDTLEERERKIQLFERYGAVLNQHQSRLMELSLVRDWSLAEIASSEGTSRAAVHDLLTRSLHTLEEQERALGLLGEEARRRRQRERLQRELESLRRRVDLLEELVEAL